MRTDRDTQGQSSGRSDRPVANRESGNGVLLLHLSVNSQTAGHSARGVDFVSDHTCAVTRVIPLINPQQSSTVLLVWFNG